MIYTLETITRSVHYAECDSFAEAQGIAADDEREHNSHHHHGEVTTVRVLRAEPQPTSPRLYGGHPLVALRVLTGRDARPDIVATLAGLTFRDLLEAAHELETGYRLAVAESHARTEVLHVENAAAKSIVAFLRKMSNNKRGFPGDWPHWSPEGAANLRSAATAIECGDWRKP